MTSAYTALEKRFRRLSLLGEAVGMLQWDMSVMMPPASAGARSEQIAALKLLSHELMTDPVVSEHLDQAEETNGLNDWQIANLRRMRRRWLHTVAVPPDLIEATTHAATASETVWRTARPENDFPAILPHLQKLLSLVREVAVAKSEAFGLPVYEAMMDLYEPDATTAMVDDLFDDYTKFLPGFLEKVLHRQKTHPDPKLPKGPFPVHQQEKLCRRLAETVGFDFKCGRLDTTFHPFSGGVPEDSRITTRYDEDDFTSAIMGVMHETGHAMYERGRPKAWRYQPVGETPGLGMHESQSLIVEMQASRSRPFVTWAAPVMRSAFSGEGEAWSAENLYRWTTRVTRGLIRVEADEVTYPAHVILRYRLERAMIKGDLAPADLPGAWNEGMRALLNVVPPDNQNGCLQDIHWYDGAWGYFPTYTLGAMAAAQLFASAKEADP
ncbi:MAG: Thermostable carboxypeptidase 1, partial [Alphaproteobacteria bacterium MarineAlpha4_Bin2]